MATVSRSSPILAICRARELHLLPKQAAGGGSKAECRQPRLTHAKLAGGDME